jgi:hypothetical protein
MSKAADVATRARHQGIDLEESLDINGSASKVCPQGSGRDQQCPQPACGILAEVVLAFVASKEILQFVEPWYMIKEKLTMPGNSTSATQFWTRRSPRPGVFEYWGFVIYFLADPARVFCVKYDACDANHG